MNHPHNDQQGRIGLHSVNASRAVFRMPPLTEEEANQPVSDPLVWVIGTLIAIPLGFILWGLWAAWTSYHPWLLFFCK